MRPTGPTRLTRPTAPDNPRPQGPQAPSSSPTAPRVDEADLFGMERSPNATGPGIERVSRKSLLYSARGGTLYFQHVADTPTRVQSRLARVLRDREAVLAETGDTIAIDVRPMASADAGIDASVQEGRVRDDLFRRLAVIRIDMPSLRQRREDIPALTNYFVREICAARRVAPKTLSRAALSLIVALPWRGNAIELRTLLESAIDGCWRQRRGPAKASASKTSWPTSGSTAGPWCLPTVARSARPGRASSASTSPPSSNRITGELPTPPSPWASSAPTFIERCAPSG